MTKEQEDEIRKFSSSYIEKLDEIERQENSKKSYEEALKEKVNADFANKVLFLKYNAELTGLTLEFRNLYGIEGGIYEEKLYDSSPFLYPDGTPNSQKYDSTLLVEACGNMSSVGERELSSSSPFFVDELRAEEGSPFYVPYCPPNLDRWCADEWYLGYSRPFYKTERVMINFLNSLKNSATTTFISTGAISGFNCNNPVEFYSNSEGYITHDIFEISTNTSSLTPPGGGSYTPIIGNNKNPSKKYTVSSGTVPSAGSILSFRLTPASGINSNEIGYAFVSGVSGSDIYLDLLSYNSNLISTPTYYSRRKLWKFWKPIVYTDFQNFSLEFSTSIPKNDIILENALRNYQNVYIDTILHYLGRIEKPDEYTEISVQKIREVQVAFNTYWASKTSGNLINLFDKINSRKNFIYPDFGVSPRAQQIHEYLKGSDIFEKVYGTLNSRINKRTGTLRELIKYSFNSSVADSIIQLKKESLMSFGDTIVVYRLTKDTNGTNGIEVQLENKETIDDFYSYIKWMNEIYIISDNSNLSFFKSRITDIQKRGDNAVAITLSENVPLKNTYKTDDNARLVKIF